MHLIMWAPPLSLIIITLPSIGAHPLKAKRRCMWGENDSCHLDERSKCRVDVMHDVLTPAESNFVVAEAERYAALNAGWTTQRHSSAPTMDLPTTLLPAVWPLMNVTMKRVVNNANIRCGLTSGVDELIVKDVFVVKYQVNGQPGLEKHADGSFLSFNLHLSSPEDYKGGGTYFEDLNKTFKIPKGSVLVHGGYVLHEGVRVTSGTRYIVAGFLGINKVCCYSMTAVVLTWLNEPAGTSSLLKTMVARVSVMALFVFQIVAIVYVLRYFFKKLTAIVGGVFHNKII